MSDRGAGVGGGSGGETGRESGARRGEERRKSRGGTPPPGCVVDRRLGLDRREIEATRERVLGAAACESGVAPAGAGGEPAQAESETSGLERRRGPGRRLSSFTKAAEEGEMTPEQFLFLMAIDEFKKANGRAFPTWTDVLEVVRLLGYRKTMASELNLTRAEDWREAADAASGVRPDNWAARPSDLGKGGRRSAA